MSSHNPCFPLPLSCNNDGTLFKIVVLRPKKRSVFVVLEEPPLLASFALIISREWALF